MTEAAHGILPKYRYILTSSAPETLSTIGAFINSAYLFELQLAVRMMAVGVARAVQIYVKRCMRCVSGRIGRDVLATWVVLKA